MTSKSFGLNTSLAVLQRRLFRYGGVVDHPPLETNTDFECGHDPEVLLQFNGPMDLVRFLAACKGCHSIVENER